MTEGQNANPATQTSNWLGQPYAERKILAGFLNPGEVEVVYPNSSEWSPDVSERVMGLLGAANSVGPRDSVGVCDISNVDDTEALRVLHSVGRAIAAPPVASFSYSWVNIDNLIAVGAVADPIPPPVSLSNNDVRSLADYSLYENIGPPIFLGSALATTGPVNVLPLKAEIRNGQLVVHYQISKTIRPIIVGYEQGRCYLLKEYGRVLGAMAQGVNRLLCLVYYGLDLSKVDMNIKGLNPLIGPDEPVNHFGAERIGGTQAPLVRDFLDAALTATIPSRASVFICEPSVQILAVQFEAAAKGPLPLTGRVVEPGRTIGDSQ